VFGVEKVNLFPFRLLHTKPAKSESTATFSREKAQKAQRTFVYTIKRVRETFYYFTLSKRLGWGAFNNLLIRRRGSTLENMFTFTISTIVVAAII